MLFDFVAFYLQLVIFILIAVAFLTLLERKVLSFCQMRKGPTKIGLWGVLQPFADALKLFSKEEVAVTLVNFFFFFIGPCLSILISLLVWVSVFSFFGFLDFKYSMVFFLLCLSLSVYGLVFSGWSSNSKYALLGSFRAVAQTISYELILAFFIFLIFLLYGVLNFDVLFKMAHFMGMFFFSLLFFLIIFIVCVTETNRAPFDLSEGESELVSGFNVEYGGLKFALIFMSEYSSIIWMSFFLSISFFSCFVFLGVLFNIFLFLFLRASFPRYRYDFLMSLMWKSFMALVLFFYLVFLLSI